MRSRYCKQIWQALRSEILVALVHVTVVIIQLHKEEYKWRANTVKIFCDIVRLFGQLVILYYKNLFNPPSMSNTTAWYKLSNVFTSRTTPASRLIYSRVVWCIHESYNPCPSLGRLPFFLPHTLEIFAKKLRVHVNVIIQLHKVEYKWRANTVKVFCDIVRLFEQLVMLYCKNLFNPPSMSNTTAWYKLSNVITSRPIYSRVVWLVRVVWCIHESYDPCPSLGRLTVFHLTPLMI